MAYSGAIHFGEGKSAGLSLLNSHNNDGNKHVKKNFAQTYGSNNIFGAYANAIQTASYNK